jgi:hypothetical protein
MTKLLLRFGNAVMKEVVVGQSGVRIGRAPDNGLVIDNHAVSHHHARVFQGISGKLLLEDLGSLNGTFVNGQLVRNVTLRPGDCVSIGKHSILVEDSREMVGLAAWKPPARPDAPRVDETMVLDTRERRELLQRAAALGENSQIAPVRMKVPTLIVRKGRTSRREYALTDKLTVIGKSAMATVKLRGWFAPKVAAQINRREDNAYYIGAAGKAVNVNGQMATRPTKLAPGDHIDVAGFRFEFDCRD